MIGMSWQLRLKRCMLCDARHAEQETHRLEHAADAVQDLELPLRAAHDAEHLQIALQQRKQCLVSLRQRFKCSKQELVTTYNARVSQILHVSWEDHADMITQRAHLHKVAHRIEHGGQGTASHVHVGCHCQILKANLHLR